MKTIIIKENQIRLFEAAKDGFSLDKLNTLSYNKK